MNSLPLSLPLPSLQVAAHDPNETPNGLVSPLSHGNMIWSAITRNRNVEYETHSLSTSNETGDGPEESEGEDELLEGDDEDEPRGRKRYPYGSEPKTTIKNDGFSPLKSSPCGESFQDYSWPEDLALSSDSNDISSDDEEVRGYWTLINNSAPAEQSPEDEQRGRKRHRGASEPVTPEKYREEKLDILKKGRYDAELEYEYLPDLFTIHEEDS